MRNAKMEVFNTERKLSLRQAINHESTQYHKKRNCRVNNQRGNNKNNSSFIILCQEVKQFMCVFNFRQGTRVMLKQWNIYSKVHRLGVGNRSFTEETNLFPTPPFCMKSHRRPFENYFIIRSTANNCFESILLVRA